jgi:two-component system, chemotaxis family, protein-glutamate methylesterase/glutaminase
VRVLIVDDSALMRTVLRDFFERHEVEVAGEAANGRLAVEMVEKLRPDLVTMDIDMPIMNGIEATEQIMRHAPLPIVIFSTDTADPISFAAFKAGAADVIRKPDLDRFYDEAFTNQLVDAFRSAANARDRSAEHQTTTAQPSTTLPASVRAVVLGASTGGPVAVKTVLGGLPADFPVGIAVVQHIEDRFAGGYAQWLDSECALTVRTAVGGESFAPGTVTVAPGDQHLIATDGGLALDAGPKVGSHRPAVDRLFETAAHVHGRRLVGVLLTGMGRDGAAGCVEIRRCGGFTIVQDQATSFIYGMPKAAAEMGGASVVKPLDEISALLMEACAHG